MAGDDGGATERGGGGCPHEPAHQFDAVGGFKEDTFDRAAGLRLVQFNHPGAGMGQPVGTEDRFAKEEKEDKWQHDESDGLEPFAGGHLWVAELESPG